MLIMPYVMGMIWAVGAGRFSWPLVLLAPVWVIGYFAFFATAMWLKSNFKPRYRRASLRPPSSRYYVSCLYICLFYPTSGTLR